MEPEQWKRARDKQMKILVVCQYYKPEPFRISDICEELVKKGHEVTVVTGVPNYPEGKIYKEYKNGKRREETIGGVKVHRCFTIGRRSGVLFRFLNYYSYVISSCLQINRMKESFDVVYVNQLSPVLMGYAGMRAKKKWKIPLVLYCLDLWPESLVAGGIRKGSFLYKAFHRSSKNIYCAADKILVTSKMFSEYFEEQFQISKKRVVYLPQYAEELFVGNQEHTEKSTVDLTFAGNIGKVQSVDTIIKAAAILQDKYDNLRWHIVGGGAELDNVKRLADELQLTNIIFHGRKPVEEMPAIYAKSDAMLVTLTDEPVLSMTLPGKVQSYMAAGKPILGAINGETAKVIAEAKCGYCTKAEDAEGLAALVEEFITSGNQTELGECARVYYTQYFAKEVFIESLGYELKNR